MQMKDNQFVQQNDMVAFTNRTHNFHSTILFSEGPHRAPTKTGSPAQHTAIGEPVLIAW